MRFEKVRGKKGWFNESERHAQAARGICREDEKTEKEKDIVVGKMYYKKFKLIKCVRQMPFGRYWYVSTEPKIYGKEVEFNGKKYKSTQMFRSYAEAKRFIDNL